VAVSGVCAVVNPLWKKFTPLPARSVTPLVFTRTVYPVEGCSGALGANVTLPPSADGVTVPLIGMLVLLGHICTLPLLTEAGSIRSLNCNRISALVSTPVAPFTGSTSVTPGRSRSASVPWEARRHRSSHRISGYILTPATVIV
jgi:hypothetical protein